MDPEIVGLCPQLTLGVALAVLPRPHWSALSPDRPLREFGLIQLDTEQGLTSAAVRIDERVLHYLAGLNPPDPRIRMLVKPIPIPTTDAVAREHAAIAENALALLSDAQGSVLVVQLCGDDPDGQEDVAALIALGYGCLPFAVRVEDLPPPGPDLDAVTALWSVRLCCCQGCCCCTAAPPGSPRLRGSSSDGCPDWRLSPAGRPSTSAPRRCDSASTSHCPPSNGGCGGRVRRACAGR